MTAKIEVIDNFLDEETFKQMENVMVQTKFDWHYTEDITTHLGESNPYHYFCHNFYLHKTFETSQFFDICIPLLRKLEPTAILRIKGNMYINQGIGVVEHSEHKDYDFSHMGALFSINTCDGYTKIGDEKIPSVANRCIIFDPSVPHTSTSTSNQKYRMNINFNMIKLTDWE